MLALVASLLVSVAPTFPSASVTCPDGPASCDAGMVAMMALAAPVEDAVEAPRQYATPAVIDCRTPVRLAVLQTLVGECDGMPRDASYRVSRYPESEQGAGTMVPASRGRRPSSAACDGLPPAGGDLTVSPGQPVALCAVPGLLLLVGNAPPFAASFRLPSRTPDRLDRPPRA
jgi:hypothetical protein